MRLFKFLDPLTGAIADQILKFKALPKEEKKRRIKVMAWSGFSGFTISIPFLLSGKSPFLIFGIASGIGLAIPFFLKPSANRRHFETPNHEKLP